MIYLKFLRNLVSDNCFVVFTKNLMFMTLRIYTYKDVVMLMAAKTLLQTMRAHLDELGQVRTNWTEAYITELILKIDTAIENFLGLDKKQPLREATDLLNQLMNPALRDLSLIKTQVEVDFKKNATEILKTLGLNKKLALLGQEELIETLFSFKKGMTPKLKTEMTAKGTNPVLIDKILGYTTRLEQANISQETLKSSTQDVSEELVVTFNSIYTEVIGIGKIASKYYINDPLKKDKFTFSKIVRNMGGSLPNPEDEESPSI